MSFIDCVFSSNVCCHVCVWACLFVLCDTCVCVRVQFQISIVVERPDGREIAKPVELRVMVGDANDNRPTFPQTQYHTVVKELAPRGNLHPLFLSPSLAPAF